MRKGRYPVSKNKRGRTVTAGSAVQELLHRLEGRIGRADQQEDVIAVWDESVGEEIARHARPLKFLDGRLDVAVDSSAWLFKLSRFEQEKIRKALNRKLGREQVMRVVFRQQSL